MIISFASGESVFSTFYSVVILRTSLFKVKNLPLFSKTNLSSNIVIFPHSLRNHTKYHYQEHHAIEIPFSFIILKKLPRVELNLYQLLHFYSLTLKLLHEHLIHSIPHLLLQWICSPRVVFHLCL